MRIIMVVRGRPLIAGILGFCESIIWLLVAGAVLGNLDNPVKVIAYVGGYAAGTMLGSNIERWLPLVVMVMCALPLVLSLAKGCKRC
ncbi:MAG: DUF5698 domain-containing protein [Deinococcales bacterium]